jgi:hypothetical protein
MYSRFEPKIANTMMWLARLTATTIAVALVVSGLRDLWSGSWSKSELWHVGSTFLAALAFLSIWRFEVVGAVLIGFAAVWATSHGLVRLGGPDYLMLLLFLPAGLSLGAWMRRTEYRVVSKYRKSANVS